MAKRGKKRVSRRRYGRKVRHSKPSMWKSVAVCATAAGGVVSIAGLGASQTQIVLNGLRQIPWVGAYLGTVGGVLTALWLLKLSGSRKWAGFIRSSLGPKWRP
jgi:hypothetical protein